MLRKPRSSQSCMRRAEGITTRNQTEFSCIQWIYKLSIHPHGVKDCVYDIVLDSLYEMVVLRVPEAVTSSEVPEACDT